MQGISEWTPDMIRFMEDASDNSQYHFRLAGTLSDFLDPQWKVCDAGSGIGQLSVALSPYVREVVAVDSSPNAIAVLQRKTLTEGLENVKCFAANLFTFPGTMKFDAMVFNYFGHTEQVLEIAKAHCLRRIVIIKGNYQEHRFSIGKCPMGKNGCNCAASYLEEHSIRYSAFEFDEDFGQPFRSLEDALLFFRIYSNDDDRSVVNLENIKKRLIYTGNSQFPYYLPQRKSSMIYVIDGATEGGFYEPDTR